MSEQLLLDLDLLPAKTKDLEDFIAGPNFEVLHSLRALLADQGERQLFLWGDGGLGKSHLLQATCKQASQAGLNAYYLPLADLVPDALALLDQIDRVDLLALDDIQAISGRADWQEAIMHRFNETKARGGRLLFAGRLSPKDSAIELPDLRSRLGWGLSYRLRSLDEAGLRALIEHETNRQGRQLPDSAIHYLLKHASRSPGKLADLLAELDWESLQLGRRLDRRLIAEHLKSDGQA